MGCKGCKDEVKGARIRHAGCDGVEGDGVGEYDGDNIIHMQCVYVCV